MSTTDYDSFVKEYGEACDDEATASSNLRQKEEFLKVSFSELMNTHGGPVSKAEHAVRCSDRYKRELADVISADRNARRAKAKVKSMDMSFEMFRSRNANRRQEMGLRGER